MQDLANAGICTDGEVGGFDVGRWRCDRLQIKLRMVRRLAMREETNLMHQAMIVEMRELRGDDVDGDIDLVEPRCALGHFHLRWLGGRGTYP